MTGFKGFVVKLMIQMSRVRFIVNTYNSILAVLPILGFFYIFSERRGSARK